MLFDLELRYPIGWHEEPWLGTGLKAWEWGRGKPTDIRARLAKHHVQLTTRSPQLHDSSILLEGPFRALYDAIELVRQDLRAPSMRAHYRPPNAYPELGWVLHGLPILRHNCRGADETQAREALARLADLQPRVSYSGPPAPHLAFPTAGVPSTTEPVPRFPGEGLRVGLQKDSGKLGGVQLYLPLPWIENSPVLEALTRAHYAGREGLARERLREQDHLSYSPRVTHVASTEKGPGWIRVSIHPYQARVEEGGHALLALVDDPNLTQERWERTRARAEERAWGHHTHFRYLADHVREGLEQGLQVDAQQHIWEQLSQVKREDFQAYLDLLAAGPRVLVLEGEALQPNAWQALGTVEHL